MRSEYVSAALTLSLYFSSALAFSTGKDATNAEQAYLGLTGQSLSTSHGNLAGDKVLNAVAAILNLYDFMTQPNPSEHAEPKNASSHIAPESKVTITAHTPDVSSSDSTAPPGADIITTSCKGPHYCCCATGCTTACPLPMLPAFPELNQTLTAFDVDMVEIPCQTSSYCCCRTGCPSSTYCPRGIAALFPDLMQELASKDEL